jgi:hypothetical protein
MDAPVWLGGIWGAWQVRSKLHFAAFFSLETSDHQKAHKSVKPGCATFVLQSFQWKIIAKVFTPFSFSNGRMVPLIVLIFCLYLNEQIKP